MSILVGNLLIAVGQVLGMLINLYIFILLGRVIISWVNADPYNPIVRFLTTATDPLINPIRRRLPRMQVLDLSPLVLLLGLYFLNAFLVSSLIEFGQRIKMGL